MDAAGTIFISHATPEDNQFTLWLALRLMALGYQVWCDLLKLSKGGDFWCEIESQIRIKTCKFLLVQSKISNSRDGVLKEIAVAQKVKKTRNDANFILPLKIDPDLSYDDINVEVLRLNSVDFTGSWATGLTDLQKALIDQNCPRTGMTSSISTIVDRLMKANQSPIEKDESYDSNWFDIQNPPDYMFFYPVKQCDENLANMPVLTYKNHIVTFWGIDNMPPELKILINPTSNIHRLKATDYLSKDKKTDFIWSSTYKRLYVGVLSKVFDHSIRKCPGIMCYDMSKHLSFLYPKDALENDRVGRILLVGKHKQFHWHFAISGSVKLSPIPMLQICSHVVFSTNGRDLVRSDAVQHRARRSIGKCWWNKEWRARLLAFVTSLQTEDGSGYFVLKEGVDNAVHVSCVPIQFMSKISYADPGHEAEEELDNRAKDDIEDGVDFDVVEEETFDR